MQFQHKYRLRVGRPKITKFRSDVFTEQSVVGIQDIPVSQDTRTEQLDAVEITELHFTAIIGSKSGNGSKSTCTIDIYNLSESSLEIVERINNYVILEAGFATTDELPIIFTGQVVKFETKRSGLDRITTLTCQDGYIINNSVRVSKTYPKKYTVADVIDDLIDVYKSQGVALGYFVRTASVGERNNYVQVLTPLEREYPNGISVMGYLSTVMKKICDSVGYVYYIANGKLFIHPAGHTKQIEKFTYTEDMCYSLNRTATQANTPTGKEDIGLAISVQLDGRLEIDKLIEIADGDYIGLYKILTVKHNLNYEDGPWDTILTCKKLNIKTADNTVSNFVSN